jgi:hypothetical protein
VAPPRGRTAGALQQALELRSSGDADHGSSHADADALLAKRPERRLAERAPGARYTDATRPPFSEVPASCAILLRCSCRPGSAASRSSLVLLSGSAIAAQRGEHAAPRARRARRGRCGDVLLLESSPAPPSAISLSGVRAVSRSEKDTEPAPAPAPGLRRRIRASAAARDRRTSHVNTATPPLSERAQRQRTASRTVSRKRDSFGGGAARRRGWFGTRDPNSRSRCGSSTEGASRPRGRRPQAGRGSWGSRGSGASALCLGCRARGRPSHD